MNEILYTTINKFFIKTKNEDGSPLINSNGEPYKQVRIKIPEYGDQVLSHYVGNNSQYPSKELDMVEGEMYWLKIEKKEVKDKTFYNFKLASETDKILKRLDELEATVYKTPQAQPTTSKPLITKKDLKTAEEQPFESEFFENTPPPEDIPF